MSYREIEHTVIDLEYGQDPNKFWKHLFIIILVSCVLYFLYYNN